MEESSEIIQKKPNKKIGAWKVYGLILTVLLIFAIFTKGFSFSGITGRTVLNADSAAEKAVDYINNNLIITGKATLKSVEEENDLYKIEIEFEGQIIESYVSKDGKLLFPSAIPLNEPIIEPNIQEQDIPKSDKPVTELFVFSYCPYSLQFQKAMLSVYELLKDKADIDIVAIGAMHGEYEKIESLRQTCIEKEYGKDKLWNYLEKFMGNTKLGDCKGIEDCVNPIIENIFKDLKIDKNKINSCTSKNAEEIYQSQNSRAKELGISGSPTFVINNIKIQVNRNPEAIKKAICNSFTKMPDECNEILSSQTTSPWFGYASSSSSSAGTC